MKSKNKFKKTLLISGPTSIGKTDLAIHLAKKFNGEIISADSRQVYIGLDYGTNKFGGQIDKWRYDQQKKTWFFEDIPVFLYDLVIPNQSFSVFDFVKIANHHILDVLKRDKLPIIVGGTGFYQKALIFPIKTLGIPPNHKIRKILEKLSTDDLAKQLKILNPEKALSVDASNRRRLIRAIEVIRYSAKIPKVNNVIDNYFWIGLTAPREILYQRVESWVEKNLDKIIKETKKMISDGYRDTIPLQGIIYKSTILHLESEITREELINKLKSELKNYIRRQITWFKKEEISWFDITDFDYYSEVVKHIQKWLNKRKFK